MQKEQQLIIDVLRFTVAKGTQKKHFELITSEWQLEEFRRVSRYPKSRNFINPVESGLKFNTFVYASLPTLDLCKDPDDNPILAIALDESHRDAASFVDDKRLVFWRCSCIKPMHWSHGAHSFIHLGSATWHHLKVDHRSRTGQPQMPAIAYLSFYVLKNLSTRLVSVE